ncbi:protein of unknown function [Azospirillum lipoferum 4B]|uniref:Uncharacterized protein n=1 Tax=Azospirillum lipoferum (strain 4B) TaxID=862719 RepID=G7Z3M4_AZOL4|nr:protein of unknown function [Azospirillum lipoferum 4B]
MQFNFYFARATDGRPIDTKVADCGALPRLKLS